MVTKDEMETRLKHLDSTVIRLERHKNNNENQKVYTVQNHLQDLYEDTYTHYPVSAYMLRLHAKEVRKIYNTFYINEKQANRLLKMSRCLFIQKLRI